MKVEVEIDDTIYKKTKELLGNADISYIMGQMWQVIIILIATYPEEFMAYYAGTASPEQAQVVYDYIKREGVKAFEKSKEQQ